MKLKFYKFTAAGNDFIIIDNRKRIIRKNINGIVKKLCDRKFGIGADGLILFENSKIAEFRMRYYNSDGSYATMCGNGARCIARYAYITGLKKKKFVFETDAGLITAEIFSDSVKVKLYEPKNMKLDLSLNIDKKKYRLSFINTGVPHTVIFVDNLEKVDVVNLGRKIRFHKKFSPDGTNVNFVKLINSHTISIRTYERGVEDETLACGTGVTASAIISILKNKVKSPVNCITRSGIKFKVFYDMTDVYLQGPADLVFSGEILV